MIYLGDNWPDEYRGELMTLNYHGRRINVDRLDREGSGYVGRHEPDICFSADPFFRGIDLTYGPDGGVFVLDWSDTGECHESTGVHRSSGRIYKITYQGAAKPNASPSDAAAPVAQPLRAVKGDLTKLTSEELVKLHEHRNEWFVRMARRELQERFREGLNPKSREQLLAIASHGSSFASQSRGLINSLLIRAFGIFIN
jgi:hypothetical protein